MRNIYLLAFLCLCFCYQATAQKKSQVDDEMSAVQYNRNSISVLFTKYNDNWDHYSTLGYDSVIYDDKFDVNFIPSHYIILPSKREDNSDSLLDIYVNQLNIGREIIAYWLNRKADGSMDVSVMEERSLYNASDQDKLNAQAAKVSMLKENGGLMIPNSYIVIFDIKKVESSNGTGTVSADAYVYQIEFTEDDLNNLYMNGWINDNDPASVKQTKKAYFENLTVPMTHIFKKNIVSSGETIEEAVKVLFDNDQLSKMEKKIDNWKVKSSVFTVKPILAKIGKKEGVRNGDRYRAYIFREDKDGKLFMVKRGYVRATTIVDNRDSISARKSKSSGGFLSDLFSKKDNESSKGDNEPSKKEKKSGEFQSYLDSLKASCFYQISGRPLKEGMLLQQDKDSRVGISASAQFGGISLANVRVDYLGYIHKSGIAHYGILNFGFDLTDEYPFMMNYSVGYGCGLPVSKAFEFQPFILVGADVPLTKDNIDFKYKMGWFANAGLRFSFMPVYHVQIFVQGDYSFLFKQGTYYDDGSSSFLGWPQRNRMELGLGAVGLSLGVRVAF